MAVVVWALVLPNPLKAEDEIPVAVMEFTTTGGVTQKQVDALSDLLANEIRKLGNYRVIGQADIRAGLSLEEKKELLGCGSDSCLAELGGALGARWVALGNVGAFGESFLLNLKLMDVSQVKVLGSVSKKVDSESGLIDSLASAARELMAVARPILHPDEPAQTDQAATVTTSVESQPGPLNTWAHAAFWSGVGLTAAGALALVMAVSKADDYADSNLDTDTRLDARDASRLYAGLTWTGFGLGAALLATGAALWVLDEPEQGAAASVRLVPVAQGLVLGLGGRW
jgi:hypothetical protein